MSIPSEIDTPMKEGIQLRTNTLQLKNLQKKYYLFQ